MDPVIAPPAAAPEEQQMWAVAGAPPERLSLGDAYLRRWTPADLDVLHAATLASQAHLLPWMPWAKHISTDDPSNARGYLARSEQQWGDGTSFNYAIIDASGTILGSAGLMGRVEPGGLEIGYWVHVDHTGRGLATRSAAALTEAGLALPEVDHIEIHHDTDNRLSGRVPPRLGYVFAREIVATDPSPGGTGIHAVWEMSRTAWPTSPGAALLAAARA
jgi:RimJ/RimL family protein N-acetyltransferase